MWTKPKIRNAALGLTIALSGWAAGASGQTAENPYAVIAARNAFNLREIKDEPKPPPPVEEPEPEEVDVTLTGFSEIKGVKRAYFMIPDSENPGRFHYYSLKENEGSGAISKVLNIDSDNGKVQVELNNRSMALNLEEHGFDPNKGRSSRNVAQNRNRNRNAARQAALARSRAANNRSNPAAQQANSTRPTPTVIGRGGETNFGSNDQNANSRASQLRERMNERYGRSGDGDSTSTAGDLRSIPTRRVRGSNNNRRELNEVERTMGPEERIVTTLADKVFHEQQGIPYPPLPFGPNARVRPATPNPNGQE